MSLRSTQVVIFIGGVSGCGGHGDWCNDLETKDLEVVGDIIRVENECMATTQQK